jgi:hypothetical protein
VIKSGRIWVGHVAFIGETRAEYQVMVKNHEGMG